MPRFTDEQIEALKAQHKVDFVHEIECEGLYGYLKPMDRQTAAKASAMQSNPVRSNEAILNGLWIGGDDKLKNEDRYFLSVQAQLSPLLEGKLVTITKR